MTTKKESQSNNELPFQVKKYKENFWNSFKGKTKVYKTLKNYIENISPDNDISYVVEDNYIDKDFLLDYVNYYSRCFDNIEKKTKRIHFFKSSPKSIEKLLKELFLKKKSKELNKNKQKLSDHYIGFLIRKPINENIIGRCILKKYSEEKFQKKDSEFKRKLNVFKRNTVHFFGIPLKIDSLPFQEQDKGVSACATVSVWSSLKALENKFKVSFALAPSEITNLAYETIISSISLPKFPNQGLIIEQIENIFWKLGYNIIPYKADNVDDNFRKDYFTRFIKSFINYGIPILVTLKLQKNFNGYPIYHEVVISGYQYDINSGDISKLYIHDDQFGPYLKVEFEKGNLLIWDYEWKKYFDLISVDTFLIPLYEKIRLNFTEVYEQKNEYLNYLKQEYPTKEITFKGIHLYDINKYKSKIIYEEKQKAYNSKNGKRIIFEQLPKYFWILEYTVNNKITFEILFDATTHFQTPLVIIHE